MKEHVLSEDNFMKIAYILYILLYNIVAHIIKKKVVTMTLQ